MTGPSEEYVARLKGRLQWVYEFGTEFCVPSQVTDDPELSDISWHNDVSPSFCLVGQEQDTTVRLWIDHPDAEQREFGDQSSRFSVLPEDGEAFYQGDDINEAVRVLKSVGAR